MTVRSIDARLMLQPARTFKELADRRDDPHRSGWWTTCRRPLFIALVLSCMVSLLASGALTLRFVPSAFVYWASIPFVEALALVVVLRRRRARLTLPVAIDLFFAGHGPWTALLIAIGATLSLLPPQAGWTLLLRLWVPIAIAVILWSAYIDFCFFRSVTGASRASATRTVALLRVLTWTAVIAIFAAPSMTLDAVTDVVSTILAGR